MSQAIQRQLGEYDSPIEDELEDAFTRMLSEGTQRMHRTWRGVLVTGFFGGTEVALGVLAYLSVLERHPPAAAGGSGVFDRLPGAPAGPQRAVHGGVSGTGRHRGGQARQPRSSCSSCGAARCSPTWSAAGSSCG